MSDVFSVFVQCTLVCFKFNIYVISQLGQKLKVASSAKFVFHCLKIGFAVNNFFDYSYTFHSKFSSAKITFQN
jgi:hypothetical protein